MKFKLLRKLLAPWISEESQMKRQKVTDEAITNVENVTDRYAKLASAYKKASTVYAHQEPKKKAV